MRYFYDVETFPNFFSALFLSDAGDQYEFVISDEKTQRTELIQFLRESDMELVGYNSIHFDDIVIKGIIDDCTTPEAIYNLAQQIISNDWDAYKQYRFAPQSWVSVDLMRIIESYNNKPSLKSCSIHLRHERLQDLPYPFSAALTPEQMENVIEYNWNDVYITEKLYYAIEGDIQLRRDLSAQYDVNLLGASESKIANVIYEKEFGKPKITKTSPAVIDGASLIPQHIQADTPELKKILDDVSALVLTPDENKRYSYSMALDYFGTKYKMGVGGLHSEDEPGVFRSTDTTIVRDADVASYYPAIIINEGLVPRHLDTSWLDLFIRLRDERVVAKKAGDKTKANGLKIALNGTSGKLNSEYFWLYDSLRFFQMTLAGQLYLLDLIEKLAIVGIQTISANTDGIVCDFDKALEPTYFEICEAWEARTGFELEYNTYSKYVRLNVNSYLSITDTGKVKTKKDFYDATPDNVWTFRKGFNAPVIAQALTEYFVNGTSPEDFIPSCDDIHSFLITQRAGKKFKLYTQGLPGLFGGEEVELQKTNRYYVATYGDTLVKKDGEREISILKGEYAIIINDIVPGPYPIKYQYYIDKVRATIQKIEKTTPIILGSSQAVTAPVEVMPNAVATDIEFDVMVNRKYKNKEGRENQYDFNTSFLPETHTLESFKSDVLENGFAFSPMFDHTLQPENFSDDAKRRGTKTPKHKENWLPTQFLFVDDDTAADNVVNRWTTDPFFKQTGTYLAESHSSTDEAQKAHAIWILSSPIPDSATYKFYLSSLVYHFSQYADTSVKDVIRTMYSTTERPVHYLGNILTMRYMHENILPPYKAHLRQMKKEKENWTPIRNPLAYAKVVLPTLIEEFKGTEKGSEPCRHAQLRKYWFAAANLTEQDEQVGVYNKTLRDDLIAAGKANNYITDHGDPFRLARWVAGAVNNG